MSFNDSIACELAELRRFCCYMEQHDYLIPASVFRVRRSPRAPPLPRHLNEADYRRLEQVVCTGTQAGTPVARL